MKEIQKIETDNRADVPDKLRKTYGVSRNSKRHPQTIFDLKIVRMLVEHQEHYAKVRYFDTNGIVAEKCLSLPQ